ncbi:type IX secretion system anionic LPS delivery protein PorZ [Emticicia sp. 17c]|uniref:type IX secretion system anionic LPS delivery protein PorZ n=1 Tax=Emticicia sp. 17c TaxID=3127704 RepID=UPI00301BFCF5
MMLRTLLSLLAFQTFAQIPTNTWRTHSNYSSLKGLEVVGSKIYAYSDNGFFYYDKLNKQAIKLSKADGLAEANIAHIRYNPVSRKMLIAYETGNLDLIEIDTDGAFGTIHNIDFIKQTNTIQGSKHINAIEYQGDFAYLASDFGLVVLDTRKSEIKETYQNIGQGGGQVSLQQIAFTRDSIFVNASGGILGAKFAADVNLQFFGNWHLVNNPALFKNPDYPKDPLVVAPKEIETDNEGKTWIADNTNGLLGNQENIFKTYSPNGIQGTINEVFYVSPGLYAKGTQGNVFQANEWKQLPLGQIPVNSKDIIDAYDFRWQIVNNGVRVTNPTNGLTRLYTTGKNTGNLPSSFVNTIALDREGTIWIGTNDGIAGIIPARDIFTRANDAYTPYNTQGRRVLLQETITKIVIDGGNRKWIGTTNGLNLFNNTVDELVAHFAEDNSPLPTNEITDIGIDNTTGEVFVLTPKGLLSYQSNATEPQESLSNIKIFPNPIRPDFQGVMTVSGLKENTAVKITDAAGRLIYETKSNGGTASWDIQNATSGRNISGIYMVFCIAADGSESLVGKVAVIK